MSDRKIRPLPRASSIDITSETIVPISNFNERDGLVCLKIISLNDLCRVICEEVTKHSEITMEEMPSGKIKFTKGV